MKNKEQIARILYIVGTIITIIGAFCGIEITKDLIKLNGYGYIFIAGIILIIIGGVIDPDEIDEEDTGFGI
jgi:surface polysaccharide O-acyltransferase-like enzyme